MHYIIKQSTRKVKNHSFHHDGIYDHEFIPANTFYLRVTNGTIGPGARYINIDIVNLNKELKHLENKIKDKPDNQSYDDFTADDIPF